MAEWHSPAVLASLLGAKAVVLVEDDVTDDVGSSLKTLDDSLPKSSGFTTNTVPWLAENQKTLT